MEIEQLGYGTVWVGASPAADLAFVEPILEKTESLQVATGIVNIWTADAREVALRQQVGFGVGLGAELARRAG